MGDWAVTREGSTGGGSGGGGWHVEQVGPSPIGKLLEVIDKELEPGG